MKMDATSVWRVVFVVNVAPFGKFSTTYTLLFLTSPQNHSSRGLNIMNF